VFFKLHTMVLLELNGFSYLLQYTLKIMGTHSCGDLLSCTLYIIHHLFSPFLCPGSTGMLSSSYLALALPHSDGYAFTLVVRLPADPHLDFGIYVVSKDASSVETKN